MINQKIIVQEAINEIKSPGGILVKKLMRKANRRDVDEIMPESKFRVFYQKSSKINLHKVLEKQEKAQKNMQKMEIQQHGRNEIYAGN